ncbi:unnamed protein product [Rotaria sp. Silwood1]|nr:unnamed protein product [Rotaria sp. Silwood1]CAF4612992.1 unnamed protein product [Rotaria sp. Silwood1]
MSILGQSLPIKGRLVVLGLPRTSTTLLYNLLACDTNCRAPLYTYICIDMVPSIVISDSIQQQQRANTMLSSTKEIKHFADYQSQMAEAHPFLPIEEDYLILRHTSYLPFVTYIGIDNESDSDTWLQNEMCKDYACDYHETVLRMLNSVDMPSSHCRDQITKRYCQLTDRMVYCIMKFHESQKQKVDSTRKVLFNMTYDNLMNNPIVVVHRIYDYFGLDWSTKFETAMQKWLTENPQGKQGHHSYSQTDFALTCEEIETRYADYTKLFLSQ